MAAASANGQESFLSERLLFGGTITCRLPRNAQDVSEIRDIPDNQEVFCHVDTDQSVMVDILEYQSHVQGEDALRYHFDDISNSNKALPNSEVVRVDPIPREKLGMTQCQDAWILQGRQLVSKFNEGAEAQNALKLTVALFRLPQHTTDIIMTFNDPMFISQSSSSYKAAEQSSSEPWTYEIFERCVQSLQLKSPETLFGE